MKIFFVFTVILLVFGALMMQAEACTCGADYTPVCATNGKTFSNACRMKCSGGRLRHRGPC